MMAGNKSILSVRGLGVSINSTGSKTKIIEGVDFDLNYGSTLGLIGESGSGKSILCKAILKLLPQNGSVTGSIKLNLKDDSDIDILSLSQRELMTIRGKTIGFLSQEPSASMNPVLKCGKQVFDALPASIYADKHAGNRQVLNLLELAGLKNVKEVADSYPHELSGGMLQRVAIAAALAGEPSILIADEPTTALDATSQIGIMKTLSRLKDDMNISIILVSHDLDLILNWVDDLMVMYLGRIVEFGNAQKLLSAPSHPYTKALLDVSKSYTSGSKLKVIPGDIPSIETPITGCKFHPRCEYADDICSKDEPSAEAVGHGGTARCYHPLD
ncbi:MAG: ABC transporter ATP-binding protein [Candidatus Marinimicrobia bacterium]|nr:ABC transporter ATP-binding protein [Candidatus Neomarinimicrobiota bacterium]